MVGAGVTSVTVWPGGKGREMTIHLLPPSSSAPAMASLTRSYAAKQVPLEDITVKRVDEDMRRESILLLWIEQRQVFKAVKCNRALAFYKLP